VLSDPEKRARYDRFGRVEPGAATFDPSVFGDFSDILGDLFGFGELFGGGRRRSGPAPAPGADLRYDLTIEFEEAARGVTRQLEIPRLETCAECAGSGAKRGSSPTTCPACGGRGQLRFNQGFLTVARTCPQCRGQGTIIREPCPQCRGAGRIERERALEVRIPPGVDRGARLRLVGEGEHGRFGGPRGDLYVVIDVEPHPELERDGIHTHAEIELTFPQAVLGTKLEVATLWGRETVDVPPGTQPGTEFRLRGQGMPKLGASGRGDHVLHAVLQVPKPQELSAEQVEVVRRLAELQGSAVKEDKGVLGRVRDLFS